MELKLELEISTRAKSPLMELVSIKEDVGALLDLSGQDTCSHNLERIEGLPTLGAM